MVEYYSDLYQHRDGLVGVLLLEGARDPEVAALIQEPLGSLSRLGDVFADYHRSGRLVEESTAFAVRALLAPLLLTAVLRRISSSEVAFPDARSVVQRFLKGRLAQDG